MAVSEIIYPIRMVTPSPTPTAPLFANLYGGCFRMRKFVLVQIQIFVNGTFAANDYYTAVSGVPYPNIESSLQVTTNSTTAKGASATVRPDGTIRIDSGAKPLTNETLFITGIYLSQ